MVFWSEVLEARGEKAADEDRAGLGCEEAVSSGPRSTLLGGPLKPSCLSRTLCPFIQHTDISLSLRSNVFFNLFPDIKSKACSL